MTDSALQEIELPFAGRTFRLRPNWRKLIEVEAALQQPSRALGLKFLRFEASVTEITAVLWVLLKDEKEAPPRETLGETLMDEGYDPLMVPIGNFLLRAIRGNKIHEQDELEKRRLAALAAQEGGKADENPQQAASS
jgi:hypothetical protein